MEKVIKNIFSKLIFNILKNYMNFIIIYHFYWKLCQSRILVVNPNLGRGEVRSPSCWLSFNNSETVKAVTLLICIYIKDICDTFGILKSPQSLDIGQNSDRHISNFQISGQSFIKNICHNSIISNYIEMKLGPVSRIDKGNTAMSKKVDNDFILVNCNIIVIFSIYSQF